MLFPTQPSACASDTHMNSLIIWILAPKCLPPSSSVLWGLSEPQRGGAGQPLSRACRDPGGQGSLHLSSLPFKEAKGPSLPGPGSTSQLATPRGQQPPHSWGHQRRIGPPTPFSPGPSAALTSGVGHDLGLLWMDSEREELERDSAFLAVLRGTPVTVVGTGSEDFGVQRPGEPGGRSRSKEKMARGLWPEEGLGSKGRATRRGGSGPP